MCVCEQWTCTANIYFFEGASVMKKYAKSHRNTYETAKCESTKANSAKNCLWILIYKHAFHPFGLQMNLAMYRSTGVTRLSTLIFKDFRCP